jgi:dTDP-4-dehydrorhamnose 3,5-epimerase
MIEGVKTKNLKVIPDELGWLLEILRCNEDLFEKFRQIYLTTGHIGVVKA